MFFNGCTKTNTDIDDYLNSGKNIDEYAKKFMPPLEELPKYENIHYQHDNIKYAIFESDSMTLDVEYDEETYKKEKEKLDDNYEFLEDKVPTFDGGYLIPENEFSVNSYEFRVVEDNSENGESYPKSFGMLGTSDEKNSIVYLYFFDFDIDYIYGYDKIK